MGEINDRERALAQVLWAVRNDDVNALVKVIGEHNDYTLVNAADYDKRTPLHVAASNNSLKAASMLLSVGACVDALDRWNNTPMANAQSSGFQDMVKLLTYNGARPVAAGDASESGSGSPRSKPPSPHKMDWMIDPREIDLSDSSLIGKGSFGEIRQATWRGTKVAVKSIRNSLSKVINDVRQPLFWIFQKQKFVILCGSTQSMLQKSQPSNQWDFLSGVGP
jgi:ankyrin repeat protein